MCVVWVMKKSIDLIAISPLTSCVTLHFIFLSFNNAQVRDWLNYGFLLAFMILEFMRTAGTFLRPSSPAPRCLRRILLLKPQCSHRIRLNTEVQMATTHQLEFAENGKSMCHSLSVLCFFAFTGWAEPKKPKYPKSIRQSLCWKESSRPARVLLLNISSACKISLVTQYNKASSSPPGSFII